MSEVERLSGEQLAHLEELLRERGAPIVPRLQPPATPEAVAAVEEHLGRPLPLEVKQGAVAGSTPVVRLKAQSRDRKRRHNRFLALQERPFLEGRLI